MQRLVLATLLVAGCASAPASSAQRPGSDPADVAALRDLIARNQAANNAGDVDAWVSLFSRDAVYMAPGMPAVTTPAELREVARAGFANRANVRIEPLEIEVHGDWAYSRNLVTGTVALSDARTIDIDLKQLVIYRRLPDGWKIHRLIGNTNR